MRQRILFLFLLLIFSTSFTFAQSKKFSANVKVDILTSEKTIENEMYGVITQNLLKIDDVILQKKADYLILILIEKIADTPKGGHYAMTYSFGKNAECIYSQTGKPIRENCNSMVVINSITLFVAENLTKKGAEIATAFDKLVLEDDRKTFNAQPK